MLESITFQDLVRYRHDPHWPEENKLQDFIETKSFRRLESDADHSWHLADMVLLLGPHWPDLDLGLALKFAILHDKLEIFTGDDLAVGLSGTGKDSHAFDLTKKTRKKELEQEALTTYIKSLPKNVADIQKVLFDKYFAKQCQEARFVDALDKMQVFIRILYAKDRQPGKFAGPMHKDWLYFIENYQKPRVAGFSELIPYNEELLKRIIEK